MPSAVLDRDLTTAWLDIALRVARRKLPVAEARGWLRQDFLETPLGEEAVKKTVTALTRIWLAPIEREAGHALWALSYADRSADWRPLHLGMFLADEPFVRSLMGACGRELIGKDQIDTVSLRLRMRNAHGPRRSIDVATQRGVKTLRSLGILIGEPATSVSNRGCLEITDPELAAWLVRCLLLGRSAESIALDDLTHAPELFGLRLPRSLPRSAAGVSKHVEGVGRTVLALDP